MLNVVVVDIQKPNLMVPTPVNLVKYIEDPDYEHEDFNLSAAGTLRARVSEYWRITVRTLWQRVITLLNHLVLV